MRNESAFYKENKLFFKKQFHRKFTWFTLKPDEISISVLGCLIIVLSSGNSGWQGEVDISPFFRKYRFDVAAKHIGEFSHCVLDIAVHLFNVHAKET